MTQTTVASPLPQAAPPAGTALRWQAIRGSAWTLGGYGIAQVLRFAANLALTRLLFPEAFGLMALVNILLQGLQMWSDLGIPQSVIQNRRSDPAFLNTAWSLQVGRGFVLWLASCLLAWPFAAFYGNPLLAQLIPVAGLSAVITGFGSTAQYVLNRQLRLGRLTILDLFSQGGGILIMLAWLSVDRSVWALVAGGVGGAVLRTAGSHLLDRRHRDRFAWDGQALRSIIHFGRWLFVSSILTFFAAQADRLMLGRMLDAQRLGLYSIALMLAGLLPEVTRQLDTRVLFPVYSESARSNRLLLSSRLAQIRLRVHAPMVIGMLVMAVFGQRIIRLLYDARYADVGMMLQILTLGVIARIICSSYGPVLVAIGATFDIVLLLITQLVLVCGLAYAGFRLGGESGFLLGVAAVEWVNYLAVAAIMRRHGLWQPQLDLPLMAAGLATFAVVVLPALA